MHPVLNSYHRYKLRGAPKRTSKADRAGKIASTDKTDSKTLIARDARVQRTMPGGLGLPNAWSKAHDVYLAEMEGMGDYDLEQMVMHLRRKFPGLRNVQIETSMIDRRVRCIEQVIGDEDISESFKRGNQKAQLEAARAGYPIPEASKTLVEYDIKEENQKMIDSYNAAITTGVALTPTLMEPATHLTPHTHLAPAADNVQVSNSCLAPFTSTFNAKDPSTPSTKKGKSLVCGPPYLTPLDLSWQEAIKAAGPFWHEERAPAPGYETYEELLSDGTWTQEPVPTGKTGPVKAKMVPRL